MIALAEKTGALIFRFNSLEGGSSMHTSVAKAANIKSVYDQHLLGHSIDSLISEYNFSSPHMIKLDVDGAEFEILQGAQRTLREGRVKTILVEVRTSDDIEKNIVELLQPMGFELIARHYRGADAWNDIFTKIQIKD
jgi:hypothetical protein